MCCRRVCDSTLSLSLLGKSNSQTRAFADEYLYRDTKDENIHFYFGSLSVIIYLCIELYIPVALDSIIFGGPR